jgi:hypothetical protein
LQDISKEILEQLLQVPDLGKDRPVIFIAHSFGGVITKKLLVEASLRQEESAVNLIKNTRGVILFGTPSQGKHLITYVTLL